MSHFNRLKVLKLTTNFDFFKISVYWLFTNFLIIFNDFFNLNQPNAGLLMDIVVFFYVIILNQWIQHFCNKHNIFLPSPPSNLKIKIVSSVTLFSGSSRFKKNYCMYYLCIIHLKKKLSSSCPTSNLTGGEGLLF